MFEYQKSDIGLYRLLLLRGEVGMRTEEMKCLREHSVSDVCRHQIQGHLGTE